MHIPERLEAKLKEDKSLRSSVDAALSEFGPWLAESKLPFFPDYTNHGAEHVEGVLVTASSLIGDEAWDCVTAADACVLILAALLHDCAMHLSEDGFAALVNGRTHTKRVEGFGDADWPALWQEFLFSAKRFDDRALADLFGQPVAVRTPPADKGPMTLNDRLLVGEFVRRHHPRLAHEIAVRGVPGPCDHPVRLSVQLDEKYADLAGLVARSHGLPLRATFEYLNTRYHRREYKGVHAVFLMAVLRVADYMQIKAERAPSQMLQVKDIRSPLSRQEWRAHHAVDNINPYEDDPEAILVQATPKDVRTYLRLKDWLGGIQEELDASWAVLGEVYGPAPKLRRLGLVIRRVRSNLDDERSFARLVEYVPRRVEFDIARSEILKLLIRPLYGDKPEIGIRELLQNSVDAVRELWDLQEQNPSLRDVDLIEQEADVVMWLDEPDDAGRATFTISDRGVGMTEEVITDYFLKVGASYRHSDDWAKQHERPDAETAVEAAPHIKSRVLRSGRFGLGVLAAFLLGDEIEVSTRHVTADKGTRFTTRLESEAVELRHDDTLKVGTTVRVTIPRNVFKSLAEEGEGSVKPEGMWDWYCQSEPSVLRLVGREQRALPQKLTLPDFKQGLPPKWFKVDDPDYEALYCNLFQSRGLTCNGIIIRDEYGGPYDVHGAFDNDPEWVDEVIYVNAPFVSVFDPEGNLPLNLTRTELSRDDFAETVFDARMRYAIAHMMVAAPCEPDYYHWSSPFGIPHPFGHMGLSLQSWFFTPTGVAIADAWNFRHSKITSVLVLLALDGKRPVFDFRRTSHDAILFADVTQEYLFFPGATGALITGCETIMYRGTERYPSRGSRILIKREYGSRLITRREKYQERFSEDWAHDQWALLISGSPPPTQFDLKYLEQLSATRLRPGETLIAAELFIGDTWDKSEVEPVGLAKYWKEIIREPVIPYDMNERRRKLAHAYEILAPYIEKVEEDERVEAAAKRVSPRRVGRRRKKR